MTEWLILMLGLGVSFGGGWLLSRAVQRRKAAFSFQIHRGGFDIRGDGLTAEEAEKAMQVFAPAEVHPHLFTYPSVGTEKP